MNFIEKERQLLLAMKNARPNPFDKSIDTATKVLDRAIRNIIECNGKLVELKARAALDKNIKAEEIKAKRSEVIEMAANSINAINKMCASVKLPPFTEIDTSSEDNVVEYCRQVMLELIALAKPPAKSI